MSLSNLKPACQQGFTLLETLVAFVLLSLVLALIMQLFSSGLRSTAAAEQRIQAAVIADGILSNLDMQTVQESEVRSGVSGQFDWQVKIEPSTFEESESDSDIDTLTGNKLFRVDLRLEWQHGSRRQQMDLSTLRLGRVDD